MVLLLLLMLLNMLRDSSRGQLLRIGTFKHQRKEDKSAQNHRNMRRTIFPRCSKMPSSAYSPPPRLRHEANFSKTQRKAAYPLDKNVLKNAFKKVPPSTMHGPPSPVFS